MSWSTLNPSGPMSCSSISVASRCVRCVTSAAAADAASDAMPRLCGRGLEGAPGAAAGKLGRRRVGTCRRWARLLFWLRDEGERGLRLVVVVVVALAAERRNGIARERTVVADLLRVLDATDSILCPLVLDRRAAASTG